MNQYTASNKTLKALPRSKRQRQTGGEEYAAQSSSSSVSYAGEQYWQKVVEDDSSEHIDSSVPAQVMKSLTLKSGDKSIKIEVDEKGNLAVNGNMVASGDVVAYAALTQDLQTIKGYVNEYLAEIGAQSGGGGGTVRSVIVSGSGNVLTAISLSADLTTITATLGKTIPSWALEESKPTCTWSEITGQPTTLAGYGITDGLGIAYDSSTPLNELITPGVYRIGTQEGKPSIYANYGMLIVVRAGSSNIFSQMLFNGSGSFNRLWIRKCNITDGSPVWQSWSEVALDISSWAKASTKPTYDATEVLTAAQQNAVNSGITESKLSALNTHKDDKKNPHAVTKAQVGLGNCDNTSDADKPVSTATQTALNTVIGNLKNTDAAVDNQFVTRVAESNGVVSVTRRELNATDVSKAGKLSNSTSGNADTATLASKVNVGTWNNNNDVEMMWHNGEKIYGAGVTVNPYQKRLTFKTLRLTDGTNTVNVTIDDKGVHFDKPLISTGDVIGFGTSESQVTTVNDLIAAYITAHASEFGSLTSVIINYSGSGNVLTACSRVLSEDGKTLTLTFTKGVKAYEKPSGGIPATDMTSTVQTSLGKADSSYQKPSGGIPKTDLASAVKTSLGKADTALQTLTATNIGAVGKLTNSTSGNADTATLASTVTCTDDTSDTERAILAHDENSALGIPGITANGAEKSITLTKIKLVSPDGTKTRVLTVDNRGNLCVNGSVCATGDIVAYH